MSNISKRNRLWDQGEMGIIREADEKEITNCWD